MADRLATYQMLVDTYRTEIGKLEATIGEAKTNVVALEIQLEAEKRRLAGLEADRVEQVTQLRGIKSVLHQMEDARIRADRANEDRDLDQV